jgi:hypothetical protein
MFPDLLGRNIVRRILNRVLSGLPENLCDEFLCGILRTVLSSLSSLLEIDSLYEVIQFLIRESLGSTLLYYLTSFSGTNCIWMRRMTLSARSLETLSLVPDNNGLWTAGIPTTNTPP